MALALAIMRCLGQDGPLTTFVRHPRNHPLSVLELNEAGTLTKFLAKLPGHELHCYPKVDMMSLPFPDGVFDLVVHSDTLEHVRYPVRGLSECHRVLKPGGFCCFTVPLIVDRLTASREGLPPSYHGFEQGQRGNFQVWTEYGCDAWKQVIQAGFSECRVYALEYPAAQALAGAKWSSDIAPAGEAPALESQDRHEFLGWVPRRRLALQEMTAAIPPGETFILIDEDKWATSDIVEGRRRLPFLERHGEYSGAPPEDATAIAELERLQRAGARFIVFGWPAFWWLDYYAGMHTYLRSNFHCLLKNDRMVIFGPDPGS